MYVCDEWKCVCVHACMYEWVGLHVCVANFSWLLHASISLNIIIK